MKPKMKNFPRIVATRLLPLSVVALNSFPALGANIAPQTPPNTAQLIAQEATCTVTNIQTGQLALRSAPNGSSKAGLDNGNTVVLLRQGSNPWVYVRVIAGPNRRVNGLEGWVNSNYLSCGDGESSSSQVRRVACDVINIRTGQLALRVSPNGRSRAGLNNGNIVRRLEDGPTPWVFVRVIQEPSRAINGLEGWVNSNYLSCYGLD
jgi:RNase P/RNase MRP subunit p29